MNVNAITKRCWTIQLSGNEVRVVYDDGSLTVFPNADHSLIIERYGCRGRCLARHLLPLDKILCTATSSSTPTIETMVTFTSSSSAPFTSSNSPFTYTPKKLEKPPEKPKVKPIPFHEFVIKAKANALRGVK